MVTNTVNDLPQTRRSLELRAERTGPHPGRPDVWRDGDALELEIAADQYDRLLAHLDHFIIMDDVELVPRGLDHAKLCRAHGSTGR